MTENICPFCLRTAKITNLRQTLISRVQRPTLVKVLFHVVLIFGMEEVVATLAQQISWNVAEHIHHALIHERELSVHRVPRDELRLVVGSVEVG